MTLSTNSAAIKLAPLKYREPLVETLESFRIANVAEFLGTVYYESNYLTTLTESLNYTCDALLKKFSRKRISYEDAMRYGRRQGQAANEMAIANCIYGGKWGLENLGNVALNDGWHHRGQGPIQLTGLYNWTRFADFIGRPEVAVHPSLILTDPMLACQTSGWYWTKFRDLNSCGSNMRAVTKLVTGAPDTAIKTRLAYRNRVRELLGKA